MRLNRDLLGSCIRRVDRRARVTFANTVLGVIILLVGVGAALSLTSKQVSDYQEMLIWTGDYGGTVDGVQGVDTQQAIKKFQKRIGHTETGELTADEAALLRKQGQAKEIATGFARVDDGVTGVSVGMPLKLISGPAKETYGQNWAAPDDSINIDTFRYSGVTLRQIFNRLMSVRERQITYFKFVDGWCVVSGIDRDNALFYVRAVEQDSTEKGALPEIRGFSVRLTGQRKDELQGLPFAMSSTFTLTPLGQKPSEPVGPPQDLLRSSPQELKEKNTISGVRGSGACFNGLGNCPPSVSPCLKGSGECPASLKDQ
jgi:peptidoglycan hydrolase-like protein with peptidoglycan-binding domain